ncbi:MAG TPA: histidine kinase [Nakamurella sp.]
MPAAVDAVTPPRSRWGITWRALLALLLGGIVWLAVAFDASRSVDEVEIVWFWAIDPAIGLATLAATLALSRRYPVPVGVATAAVQIVSSVAFGAALLALGSVATRRRWKEIAAVAAVDLVAFRIANPIYSVTVQGVPWWVQLPVLALGIGTVVAVGVAVGQRRDLLAGLRERAETAEREQAARVEATRIAERNRIARDMHDVLAHRISLVAMHAAAVGYRPDLSPGERQEAMRTIEDNARLALQELREVLGVLRDPSAIVVSPDPPQPHIGDIAALVEESRAAGMHVDLVEAVEADPPSMVAQTAHRVVREALTNARKHAPDTRVTVSVAGEPGDGLALRVTNPAPLRPGGAGLPGAGLGLVGLTERVQTAGGRISHQRRADGGFELAVWLPWPA